MYTDRIFLRYHLSLNRMRQKFLHPKFFVKVLIFVLCCLAGFYVAGQSMDLFQIKKVIVTGVNNTEKKRIESSLRNQSPVLFFFRNTNEVIKALFPQYEYLSTNYIFPSTVTVHIKPSESVGFIKTDKGYLALSKSGMVLYKERATKIPNPSIHSPQVVHHDEYQQGQKLSYSLILRSLVFLSILKQESVSIEAVDIDSVDMIACKTKTMEFIFSQSRDEKQQIHEFVQIIRKAKAGALRFKKLDLRFDKPVLQM